MSSSRCRLMEAHDKRDLIEISQLIDLTDKPIGLTRDEIGWSKVRSNASNCICCCHNNSITLVTTDDSYILDHVPLDNIQFAQTNSSLQYLALSNHRKIAIVDLVDNDLNYNCNSRSNNNLMSETKVVNLAAYGLTMNDIIFWRWLDDTNLVILSYEALFICSIDQQHINHPAYTAFSNRSRYLSMEKIFEVHQNLSALCQVNDVQRDITGSIYAISSLYSTSNILKLNSPISFHHNLNNNSMNHSNTLSSSTLRPSFGSMPSRLSQLVNNEYSSDSLRSDHHLFDSGSRKNHTSPTNSTDDEICGLVQIYCKVRDRSQLIQAHAVTFTNPRPMFSLSNSSNRKTMVQSGTNEFNVEQGNPTILVAANKIGNQMRVHFTEMATADSTFSSPVQSASPTSRFDHLTDRDFPTSIVCSHVESDGTNKLHVALITTKYGQLFVCSVTHSTVLFNTSITNDIISSTVQEKATQGLMVICRNGQVLLVNLNLFNLTRLLDESKTLRHIKSCTSILNSSDVENNNDITSNEGQPDDLVRSSSADETQNQRGKSLDFDSEILVSTRL